MTPVELPPAADVVVVGGGVVGASVAYHLAAAGAGSVLLLERAQTFGTGSTGACAGGFRHQFSSRINVELSLASVPMITGFTAEHGLPLDVTQDGYLFLVRDAETWRGFAAGADLQRSMGVPVELLDPQDVEALMPGLEVDDLVGATYCAADGIADPTGLTLGYVTLARRTGADLRTGVEVTGIDAGDGTVRAVRTATGDVATPVVVNAAGPWAWELAKTAGIDLPLEPIPRNVVVTGPFDGAPSRRTLVVDAATSFYFHREGPGVLMGMGNAAERPSFDTRVDERFVAEALLPTAVRVFPPLEEASVTASWCGLYEMTPDRHPILGPAPGAQGLYLANGFSGHGFQHAPVVGMLLAEMIVGGEARTVDVSPLSLARFDRGAVVAEHHVI